MSKRLLVVGSNSLHVYNFIALVENYFDDVLLLTDTKKHHSSVKTVALDFHLGWKSLATILKIRQIVENFKPTTVHIHQANSYAFLTLLALRGYPVQVVVTAWGSDILISPQKSFFLKKMVQYILTHSHSITADSETVLQAAQKLVSKKLDVHNINFGLDVPACSQPKEKLIYSNRLHKRLYNIDKILLSFSKFIAQHPEWKLVIAGDGEENSHLKLLCKRLKLEQNVDFIGFVDTQTNYSYYCRAQIYVSIPQSDSISLSLVESIFCGCIPFVSDLPANHEVVNEKVGFVEENLENIDFMKYKEIDMRAFAKEQERLRYLFSKALNRDKYIALYEKSYEA